MENGYGGQSAYTVMHKTLQGADRAKGRKRRGTGYKSHLGVQIQGVQEFSIQNWPVKTDVSGYKKRIYFISLLV